MRKDTPLLSRQGLARSCDGRLQPPSSPSELKYVELIFFAAVGNTSKNNYNGL